MMKFKLALCFIFGFCCLVFFSTATTAENTTQTFYQTKTASLSVEDIGEEKSMVIPEIPLNFEANVEWKVDFQKKITFTTKIKPYAKIFIVFPNGQSKQQITVIYSEDRSGVINLKPGQQCRIQIGAGQFQNLFHKFATNVTARCVYQNLCVTAEETSFTGGFKLAVYGPKNANQWIWQLPNQPIQYNASVQAVFPPGRAAIDLTDGDGLIEPFSFQLKVPDPLEADPQISATSGYEEFTINCASNSISHYRSVTTCLWDFGDSTGPQEGNTADHTYKYAGNYVLKLKMSNSCGPKIEKTWQITVRPFEIANRANINGGWGGIPLRVQYSCDPEVKGSPSHLVYLWDFGDGTTSGNNSGEHTYTRIGEYKVTLYITDEYHPDYRVDPWTKTVLAVPPVLKVIAQANPQSGQYPLTVNFRPGLEWSVTAANLDFNWDFGDGYTSSERSPSHTYRQPGIYKAKLTVKDRIYGTTTSDTEVINVRPPALISKSTLSPLSGRGSLVITGQGLIANDSGASLKFNWYIDDQLVSSDRQLRYTFNKPGEYNVTLYIIVDYSGQSVQATHSWQVVVARPDNHGRDDRDRDEWNRDGGR